MSVKPRVLVVDDDREIVMGLSVRLEAAGYDTASAHDGIDGLAKAVAMKPDAIIVDVRLPGMDGLSLLSRLRENSETREIPVVVLSANVADRTRTAALDLGARYFSEKPYQPSALLSAIESAIASSVRIQGPVH